MLNHQIEFNIDKLHRSESWISNLNPSKLGKTQKADGKSVKNNPSVRAQKTDVKNKTVSSSAERDPDRLVGGPNVVENTLNLETRDLRSQICTLLHASRYQ